MPYVPLEGTVGDMQPWMGWMGWTSRLRCMCTGAVLAFILPTRDWGCNGREWQTGED